MTPIEEWEALPRGEINFDLLTELHAKPHKHQTAEPSPEYHVGVLEILQEAMACQHLLDLAGVPYEQGYRGDVDARTYLLVTMFGDLRDRLGRISTWHSRISGPGGTFDDFCNECGHTWPCDTRRLADGEELPDDTS